MLKFKIYFFLLNFIFLSCGHSAVESRVNVKEPTDSQYTFNTPEALIKSYLKVLSEIEHPVDLDLDENYWKVLKHYNDLEFETITFKQRNNKIPAEEQIAANFRFSQESAITVTGNLLDVLSINDIDLSKVLIKNIKIIKDTISEYPPEVEIAKAVVTFTFKDKIHEIGFHWLGSYKDRWFFTAGPTIFDDHVSSPLLSGSVNKKSRKQRKVYPHEEKILLKDVYQKWIDRGRYRHVACDTLYYTDKIESHIIDSAINIISKNTQFESTGLYSSPDDEPFIITKEEQAYLLQELEKLRTHKWPADMFPDSKVIEHNDINRVVKSLRKNLKTMDEYRMCSIIYTFSKPIIFRDSTRALYLNQERYGSRFSSTNFNFYHKVKDYWNEYARVYYNND